MTRRLFVALAVGVLTLAACSSTSGGSPSADPALAFCPALATYGKTLAALDALTPTSSLADYQKAVTNAKAALAAVIAVAGPYAGAQLTSLGQAQADLEAGASALGTNATPAQAESALSDELSAVIQQVALTNNAICNFRPTPSTSS